MGPIEYWSRVLGFRYLPRPEKSPLRLLVFDLPHADLLQQEIFLKMIAALGLRREEVQVVEALPSDWAQLQASSEVPILCFSPEWEGFLMRQRPHQNLVSVPSPAILKNHPEQKKEAWAKMRTLIPLL